MALTADQKAKLSHLTLELIVYAHGDKATSVEFVAQQMVELALRSKTEQDDLLRKLVSDKRIRNIANRDALDAKTADTKTKFDADSTDMTNIENGI